MTTERKARLDTLAVASLVACCFLWGLNQVAAKVAIAEVPPLAQAAVRSLGGALLVFLWARWRGIALFGSDGSLRWRACSPGCCSPPSSAASSSACSSPPPRAWRCSSTSSPFIVALGMPFIVASPRSSSARRWSGW